MSIEISLLDALLNPQLNRNAEKEYESFSAQSRVQSLVSILHSYPSPSTDRVNSGRKLLISTLLRREVSKAKEVDKQTLAVSLETMLTVFDYEDDKACKRAFGFVVAELCLTLSLLGENVIGTVLRKIAPGCSVADVPCVRLLGTIANRAPVSFRRFGREGLVCLKNAVKSLEKMESAMMAERVESVVESVCEVGIAESVIESSQDVVEAEVAHAMSAQTLRIGPEAQMNVNSSAALFGCEILPSLMSMIDSGVSLPSLTNIISLLSNVAFQAPSFLAHPSTLSSLLNTCQKIMSLEMFLPNTRLMALEIVSTMLSTSLKPVVIQTINLQTIFQHSIQFLITGTDDDVQSWASEPPSLESSIYEPDDVSNFSGSILQSIIKAVGASTFPHLMELTNHLLQSQKWKDQRAALELLGMLVSSCMADFTQHVPFTMEAALTFAQNENPRIQFQASTLIAQLCIEDNEGLGIRVAFGRQILQVLALQMSFPVGKVVANANMAMVSYCRSGNGMEDCGERIQEDLIVPFAGEVLASILAGPLSSMEDHVVLMSGIGSVACLADVMGAAFVPFYTSVMPGLVNCMTLEGDAGMLRGCAIESASIIGQAVGRETFSSDAFAIMGFAKPLLEKLKEDTTYDVGITFEMLLTACARIATVVGEGFAAYLPVVLQLLFGKVAEKADVSITDTNQTSGATQFDEDDGLESITLSLPGLGAKKLTLNTIQLNEKAQAARAVYEIASSLPSSFAPYANMAVSTFLPAISLTYSSDVRSTAAQALLAVFKSCPNKGEILLPIVSALVEQLEKEDAEDTETMFAIADAASDILQVANEEDLNLPVALISNLVRLISSCLSRRGILLNQMESAVDENERADLEELLQCESDVLTPLVDCIGYILRAGGEKSVEIFDNNVGHFFSPFLSVNIKDKRAAYAAVCLYDDMVEFGGFTSRKYAPQLLPTCLQGLYSADEDLKRVCIYGIIQVVRKIPELLAPHAEHTIDKLTSIVEAEDESLTENSVIALTSMVLADGAPFKNLNSEKVVTAFLGGLPLTDDEDEKKMCHDVFCRLVEAGSLDRAVHGNAIVRIMAEVSCPHSNNEEKVN